MTLEEMDRSVRKEQRKRSKKQKKKRLRLWLLAGCLLLVCGVIFVWTKYFGGEFPGRPAAETWAASSEPAEGVRARISVIDVCQGSAMLIESGGEAMLVDGGGREQSSRTVAFLKARGITRLKYIVATHYDADHLYGAVGALEAIGADTVLVPDYAADSYVYRSFRQHLENSRAEEIHPAPGDRYELGSCRFTVLAPCSSAYEAENDYSIALRFTDGDHSLLVTGDAERVSEAEMVLHDKGERRLASDVLLVGHHGSASSSTAAFLQAVKPSFAVISCGAGNDYGHPKETVLNRLRLMQCSLYRTDLQGDILFLFTDNGILWEQEPCNDYTPG